MLGQSGLCQYENHYWLMGYDFWENDTTFGTTMMDFTHDPVRITYIPEQKMDFREECALVSDSNGVLFYTNGMQIMNRNYELMSGGDTISYGPNWESQIRDSINLYGFSLSQGALIFKDDSMPSAYFLIHSTADFLDEYEILPEASHIYLSKIDLSNYDGLGEVILSDLVMVNDTLAKGKIVACKQSNGKDWWILAARNEDKIYYRISFRNDMSYEVDTMEVGMPVPSGLGQAGFTPDGKMYYRYEGLDFSDSGAYVNLYDFDRCTGRLSNHRLWSVPCWGICGAAISPNSQFLYITTGLQLLQYDLWAEDIQSSELVVGEYDGYVEPGWFGTKFGWMALAPDGRIYMVPTTGGSMVMHVIDKPNERGIACNLLQHSIKLPTWNSRTLPNFPNYSLGPLPEGACDTTTIDSTMIADFSFSIDTFINPLEVHFTDLSYYDPVLWNWNFGDSHTSTEQHPLHEYDTSGEYSVCLAVTNAFRSDTTCQEVVVLDTTTSLLEEDKEQQLVISPNPFSDYIDITPSEGREILDLILTDLHGRVVVKVDMSCPCRIRMDAFPAGVYILNLLQDGEVVRTEKVVKVNPKY